MRGNREMSNIALAILEKLPFKGYQKLFRILGAPIIFSLTVCELFVLQQTLDIILCIYLYSKRKFCKLFYYPLKDYTVGENIIATIKIRNFFLPFKNFNFPILR